MSDFPPAVGDEPAAETSTVPAEPRRLNSHAVAAAAGVSQATVSNVLNRPERVAPTTYRRVMEAIDALGYVLNSSARDLRSGRGSALGIVVLDVSNPFWAELVRGFEEVAIAHRRPVIVCSSDGSSEKEQELLRLLESHQVSAVLIAPVDAEAPYIASLRQRGVKVAFLDDVSESTSVPSVGADDVLGGELVARHLIESGHRSVAFVNGPRSIPSCRDRARGFLGEFARAAPDARVVEIPVPTMTPREGLNAAATVLALEEPVTAVFCANDVLALGMLRGLTRSGVAVPQEVSLVGYDDSDFAEVLSPPLTTVHIDPFAIGRAAARLVLDAPETAEELPPPELVIRESVRTLDAG